MKNPKVQPGSRTAPEGFRITVLRDGPYLVFGHPPLTQQFLMPDRNGEIWYYKEGLRYSTAAEPVALCRCGASANKPYCDGAHLSADWDPSLTASEEPLLDGADRFEGPEVALTDNPTYCAFARMCDAKGQVWNLVEQQGDRARDLTVREADRCPAGRLSAWKDGTPHEPEFEPSLGLIEDPQQACSGPLWVRGGIPVSREDGFTYEVRNRVTLCRCGRSSNKPFCDGAHASVHFDDGLPDVPDPAGKEW